MGKMITCSIRDTTGRIARHQERLTNIPRLLQSFERDAAKKMQETNADHVLYACKIYGADGNLAAIQFYMEPMDDETFFRVAGRSRGTLIYALHNRR